MNTFKRVTIFTLAVALIAAVAVPNASAFGKYHKHFKNVIVLIPDGCDETVQTLARWYKGEDLQVDKMAKASQKIHMANSVITGSAAAATAFATGHKTTVRFLGIGPSEQEGDTPHLTTFMPTADPYAPVASVLEAAKRRGKATGLVATSRVTHATPAAFACHIQDRGWDNDIMEHIVYNNVDVVFGGGKRHLLPESEGGKRTDGDNLLDVLLDRGYQFVETKEDMDALTAGKAWGLFQSSHMNADINRQYVAPHEPSIAEMTAKAIELLSQDKHGFFLMVEGSQVDWAGHDNDPIYMLTDFLAFDDAVKVAVDFAEANGDTLVLAYPDHNTGGMKIGHYYTTMGYTETTVEDLVDPLKEMKVTAGALVGMMADPNDDDELISAVKTWWGLDITQADVDEIREFTLSSSLTKALSFVLSKNYTVIGWTTLGHNGETVPVWVYGDDAPVGTIDNTELALIAAEAMNVNLDKVTERLYVDLDTVTTNYEIIGDPEIGDYGLLNNLVVSVNGCELPVSKDYMINAKGKRVKLPGVTVYAPAKEKVYISKYAVKMLKLK